MKSLGDIDLGVPWVLGVVGFAVGLGLGLPWVGFAVGVGVVVVGCSPSRGCGCGCGGCFGLGVVVEALSNSVRVACHTSCS
jgi:hypothetical protein